MENNLLEIVNKCRVILGMEPIKENSEETPQLAKVTGKTSDGLEIYWEDQLVVGIPVFNVDETPLPDGDYMLEDGVTGFKIEGGVITELVTPEEEIEVPEPEPPMEEPPMMSMEEIELKCKKLEEENTQLKSELENYKSKYGELNSQVTQLKSEIEKLGSAPSVTPVSNIPQEKRELSIEERRINSLKSLRELQKK